MLKNIKDLSFNPYCYWSYLLTKLQNKQAGYYENVVSILIVTGLIF